MKLSHEQISEMLEEAKPSIIEGMKQDIRDSIDWQVKQVCGQEISKFVKSWISENIVPEIEKELFENKNGLISLAVKFGETATEALTNAMLQELKANLEKGYKRRDLLKKMFE